MRLACAATMKVEAGAAAARENAGYVTRQLRGQSQRATPPQGPTSTTAAFPDNDYAKPPHFPRRVSSISGYGPGQRLASPFARAGEAALEWTRVQALSMPVPYPSTICAGHMGSYSCARSQKSPGKAAPFFSLYWEGSLVETWFEEPTQQTAAFPSR